MQLPPERGKIDHKRHGITKSENIFLIKRCCKNVYNSCGTNVVFPVHLCQLKSVMLSHTDSKWKSLLDITPVINFFNRVQL
jgi:hypothetical protein